MATATLLLSPSPRLFLHPSSSSSSSSHCFGPSRLGLGLGLGRARPWLELPSRAESSKRRRSRGNSTALRVAVDPDHPSSFLFFLLDAGYSPASYYTSLGLFVISVPGLWSLIKRSVKSKLFLLLNHVKPRDLYDIPVVEQEMADDQSSLILEAIQENDRIGTSCGFTNIEDDDDELELARNDAEGITIDATELDISLFVDNDMN